MREANKKHHKNIALLVSRMIQGEVPAFCELYKMYYNNLFRYGNIILRDEQVVEDTIQDLFVWVLENPQQIRKVKDFEIYLFQSLKKNLREHIKRNTRALQIKRQFAIQESGKQKEDSTEQKTILRENSALNTEWIKQHLDQLPSRQKETIFLRYYEGFSYDEIASILSTNNQVARNYVARAIKQLRKLISK